MKYSAILASIAATGVLARPAPQNPDAIQQPEVQGFGERVPAAGKAFISLGNKGELKAVDEQSIKAALDTVEDADPQKRHPFQFAAQGVNNLVKYSWKPSPDQSRIPADQIQLLFNAEVPEQAKNMRCTALKEDGVTPYLIQRGEAENIDFTFEQGAPWNFLNEKGEASPAQVKEVVCDEKFKKVGAADKAKYKITLAKDAEDEQPAIVTLDDLNQDIAQQSDTGELLSSLGPFSLVTLTLGPKAFIDNADLRCKIYMPTNQQSGGNQQDSAQLFSDDGGLKEFIIPVTRGGQTQTSFADGFKGKWTFDATKVQQIVCSDKFIKEDVSSAAPISNPPQMQEGEDANAGKVYTQVENPQNQQ